MAATGTVVAFRAFRDETGANSPIEGNEMFSNSECEPGVVA